MSLDLVFASKGAAGVLAEMAKLRAGSKLASDEIRAQGRDQQRVTAEINRAYRSTQTEVERLRDKAASLRKAIESPLTPKVEKTKAEQALTRINEEITSLEHNTEKTNTAFKNAFGSPASLLGPFASGVGAISLAIATIRKETQAAQDLADRAQAAKLSVGASRDLALSNAGSLPEEVKRQIGSGEIGGQIALQTGVSEAIINQAIGAGLSSSGGDLDATIKAVKTQARLLASRPTEIIDATSSVLGLRKFTKTDNALANLGLQAAIGGQSNIVSPRLQARNISPALIGAASFGLDKSGPSLFAALSNAANDTEGSQTKTAVIRLAEQVASFKGTEQASLAGLSSEQKLERLLSNEQLGKAFASKLQLDAQLKGPAIELFQGGDSVARQELAKARRVLPTSIKALAAVGQRAIDDLNLNTLAPAATRARGFNVINESFRLDAKNAVSSEEINQLKEILQRTGSSATASDLMTTLSRYEDGTSTLSTDELVSLLEHQSEKLRAGRFVTQSTGFATAPVTSRRVQPTARELAGADKLDQLIRVIEKSLSVAQETRDETRKQTNAIERSGRTVGAQ